VPLHIAELAADGHVQVADELRSELLLQPGEHPAGVLVPSRGEVLQQVEVGGRLGEVPFVPHALGPGDGSFENARHD
jgi:hypothetical protein